MNLICIYCKKVFNSRKRKVPCPNCGYQKPCSGHRMVSPIEMDLLKKRYPDSFKKDSKKDRPSGKDFKKGST